MKPELLHPEGCENKNWRDMWPAEIVADALGMVMSKPPSELEIATWAPLERAVAYDWAMREHLAARSTDDGPSGVLPQLRRVVRFTLGWSAEERTVVLLTLDECFEHLRRDASHVQRVRGGDQSGQGACRAPRTPASGDAPRWTSTSTRR